ncbi:hypothetical protein BS78_08G009500 [Paspalum vaginatum]|nr:hypothetical protein BS78_08G009500 [Paspalum vaginatum]
MAAAAGVYRRVLKAVQTHVGGAASKQHFRDFVAAEFRAPAGTDADARGLGRGCSSPGTTPTSSPASTTTRTCYSRTI